MASKKLKHFLYRALPRWLFERFRNIQRKQLRKSGVETEVYVSGWPAPRRVNGGAVFKCRPNGVDAVTFDQVFEQQEYNLGHLSHRQTILARYQAISGPALILDLGANIGASAVFLSESFSRANIVSVEPDSGNFALLKENTRDHPRVLGVHGAAAAVDGWMRIDNPDGEANGFRTREAEEGFGAVKAYSLASLIALAEGEPFFLKVDIEGGEEQLFEANWEVIDRFPVVAVEIHDWLSPHRGTSRNFMKWHVRADRDLLIHGEMIYSIANP